ncbi:hypothetical protein PENTCL1PPCAC_19090, partial [Pristionchus entomophagus]
DFHENYCGKYCNAEVRPRSPTGTSRTIKAPVDEWATDISLFDEVTLVGERCPYLSISDGVESQLMRETYCLEPSKKSRLKKKKELLSVLITVPNNRSELALLCFRLRHSSQKFEKVMKEDQGHTTTVISFNIYEGDDHMLPFWQDIKG